MKPGIILPPADVMDPTGYAQEAERLGYGSVWMPELWGSDALVQLAAVAEATEDVRLGTAIVNVFSRSPAVLSMAAATLDRFSDGRMVLGTGVSTEKAIEDLHGVPFERPVRRAHDTLAVIQEYLSPGEETVDYDGELVSVQDFPALDREIPVYHAALGPANRRVVARLADGWIPHNVPFTRLDEAFEDIAETAEEAGRDPEDITVAPYVPAAVSEDGEKARAALRGHVAYYVGSGAGYRRAVAQSFPDEASAIADHWQAGDTDAAKGAVTDEMIRALGVAGTEEEAREQLAALTDGIVDLPIVTIPRQAAGELGFETMQALSP